MNRRMLLAMTAGASLSPRLGFAFAPDDADEAEVARVRAQAKKVGLGELGVSRNDEYLAIGDAPASFRETALRLLNGLARDYLDHFKFKGFDVKAPKGRMTLVILADRREFAAYLETGPDGLVGGTYDPAANDLMFFDNRAEGGGLEAEKNNTLVLFHEATHQLTFNTGLLVRGGDIPLAIAEGLANYAEVRSPSGQTKIGAVNYRRLAGLFPQGPNAPAALPPIASLIADDDRLLNDATKQVGYSEAWLLVHFLMKNRAATPKFKAYLEAIAGRTDPSHRMDDWKASFGDPAVMDRSLAAYLRRQR